MRKATRIRSIYVQYSHARICSILARAQDEGFDTASTPGPEQSAALNLLAHPSELALLRALIELEEQILLAVDKLSPHNLPYYALELARTFNAFYRDCRVVDRDQPELSMARLLLCRATTGGARQGVGAHGRACAGVNVAMHAPSHFDCHTPVQEPEDHQDDMADPYRVLVSDSLSDAGLRPLQAANGIQVDVRTDLTAAQLLSVIGEYDALLVRSSTNVTADVIHAGKRLRVVGRAGVGVDNIDVEAATQAGVVVVNAPTGNVVAAAEHTVAMLLALARHVAQADAHVRAGLWKRSQFMGVEVRNKTLGTVGLGRVAQEVVRRAQGLGMSVVAFDPYVSTEFAGAVGRCVGGPRTLLDGPTF